MKITIYVLLVIPLFVSFSQNVGINTTNPQATLHVNGNLKFEPNLSISATRLVGVVQNGGTREFELGTTFNITNGTLEVTESVDPNIFLIGDVDQSITASVNQYNNYDIGLGDVNQDKTVIRFTGETSGYVVTGFAGGYDGRIIYFYNSQFQSVTFYNLNAASDSENKIITGSGANIGINNVGVAEFIYDGAIEKWILVNVRG
ncbi:MAG: hypothetical protein K8F54_11650 [Altibacter sp.]|uniref:hypothetical protein n=1 Tax=Altibacter sp. TaxID=2024823 RepID=UPI001DE0F786|nr:hypothetical protein [Altibacter sp.]MBZ0328254.1 hypothetical protein [Altibacter sp.]